MVTVLQDIWRGFWQGVGVEGSFLLLFILWKLAHSKIAHRIHVDHWFHDIASYFD